MEENEGKRIGYIYCMINNVNDKKYIGLTTQTIERRFMEHIWESRNPEARSHLNCAIRKYGESNFDFYEVERIYDNSLDSLKERLKEREIYYISEYGTFGENGYNCTPGGDYTHIIPRPIFEVDGDGFIIKQFSSMREAAEFYNIDQGNIYNALNSIAHCSNLKFWYYVDDVDGEIGDNIGEQKCHYFKRVYQFTLDGELVNSFNSLAEASRETGIQVQHIWNTCNGRIHKTGNFTWSYSKDPSSIQIHNQRWKTLYQFDLNYNFIAEYCPMVQGAKSIGVTTSSIMKAIRKRGGICRGYIWSLDRYPKKEVD